MRSLEPLGVYEIGVRSLIDLDCEAIGFSHGSSKKEEEERKTCTILTPFAFFSFLLI